MSEGGSSIGGCVLREVPPGLASCLHRPGPHSTPLARSWAPAAHLGRATGRRRVSGGGEKAGGRRLYRGLSCGPLLRRERRFCR